MIRRLPHLVPRRRPHDHRLATRSRPDLTTSGHLRYPAAARKVRSVMVSCAHDRLARGYTICCQGTGSHAKIRTRSRLLAWRPRSRTDAQRAVEGLGIRLASRRTSPGRPMMTHAVSLRCRRFNDLSKTSRTNWVASLQGFIRVPK